MITEERREELTQLWSEETNDPETEEWRNELTPEEEELVKGWDDDCAAGMSRLAQQILDMESRWEIITEPNCVDNYDRPCRHARCPQCGFKWTDLYSVQNYFKHCPGCGTALLWPE